MKFFVSILLVCTLIVEHAHAIDLMDDALLCHKNEVSLLLPAPKAKLIPDQVVSARSMNAPKALAYGLGFAGGVALGYGLTSLMTGGTPDGSHNTAIIAGGVLIGLSLPIAIIADRQSEKRNAPPTSFYKKPVIKTQLCIAANKNGLGLALNF